MQNLNMDTIQIQVKFPPILLLMLFKMMIPMLDAIDSYEFADLVIVRTEVGITLKWTEEDSGHSWKYGLLF